VQIAAAKLLMELAQFDQAIVVLDNLLLLDNEVVETWYLMGLAHHLATHAAEALEYLINTRNLCVTAMFSSPQHSTAYLLCPCRTGQPHGDIGVYFQTKGVRFLTAGRLFSNGRLSICCHKEVVHLPATRPNMLWILTMESAACRVAMESAACCVAFVYVHVHAIPFPLRAVFFAQLPRILIPCQSLYVVSRASDLGCWNSVHQPQCHMDPNRMRCATPCGRGGGCSGSFACVCVVVLMWC
jgi:hypothetical protein